MLMVSYTVLVVSVACVSTCVHATTDPIYLTNTFHFFIVCEVIDAEITSDEVKWVTDVLTRL